MNKRMVYLLLAILGLSVPIFAADATPVLMNFGGFQYTVSHSTVAVSSGTNSALIYSRAGGYREFYFVDNDLTASNSYYYRMDGSTTSIVERGIPFTTPFTLESSNAVAILAPVGVTGRVLRIRVREK